LTPSAKLKPTPLRKLPDDKLDIILRAKRKAKRKNKFDEKLDFYSEHSQSGNWQDFVAEEFSRRMKEFLIEVRFDSFDLISPEKKVKTSKCRCCHFYEGKRVREKCLLLEESEEKLRHLQLENRWSQKIGIFSSDVTEGHLRGKNKVLNTVHCVILYTVTK
jgi:hypothetical protein